MKKSFCYKVKKASFFSIVATFIFIIVGCGSRDVALSNKNTTKPKEIKNINFFLDISASMGGYLQGNTEFDVIIPKLLVEIENKTTFHKAIKINYISESIIPFGRTTSDFITEISTTHVDTGRSSQIDHILESISNHTDSSDISIFVSDCILSYPDKYIRDNPEINREKTGGLGAFVESAFSKMKNKNVCASIYAFNSKFNGTYYDYRNDKIQLNGDVKRPFYIWVIGNKELLEIFNRQLAAIGDFKPEMTIDFGLFQNPIAKYNLLFQTERVGDWTIDEDNNISDVETSKANPIKFAFTIDLSGLPDYARETDYLKKNLIVNGNNLKCSVADIKKTSEIDRSKSKGTDVINLQNASHVIILTVPEMYTKEGSIELKLPLQYDSNYINWSTDDDKDKLAIAGKTFAFKNLVQGVRDAYQNNNENFIQLNFTLKK